MFSFNAPYGACEKCTGLGTFLKVDPELVIPNKHLTIREGAIRASGWYYAEGGIAQMYYEGLADHYGFSLDAPVKDLPKQAVEVLLYGTKGEKILMHREGGSMKGSYYTDFEGIVNNLERRFRETNSARGCARRSRTWMNSVECPVCHGNRLNDTVLAVTVGGHQHQRVLPAVGREARLTFSTISSSPRASR